MEGLILAVLLFVVMAIIINKIFSISGTGKLPYESRNHLLTKGEMAFYSVLVHASIGEGIVFSKVRMADVFKTKKGLNNSQRQIKQNQINQKHFDFVICDPKDSSFKLIIELDDKTHNDKHSKKKDQFKNDVCESAAIPLLRIKAAKNYDSKELKKKIKACIRR